MNSHARDVATVCDANALPALLDRAATTLSGARTSAEVLEARDMASAAYDAARSVGRIAKAKQAHDEVIGAVYRAQADAALIEARAKMRLADEYDAAQERGEVGKSGTRTDLVGDDNEVKPATAADLGLRRDQIHEARQLRNAEAKDPGKAERVMADIVARGEEPTKAKLRKEMVPDQPTIDQPEDDKLDKKLRRHFRKMTPQAQEDDWIGLKRAMHDATAKSRKLRAENEQLKERLKLYRQEDNNSVIRALEDAKKNAENAKWRAIEEQARQQKQIFALKKRVEELEQMGVVTL